MCLNIWFPTGGTVLGVVEPLDLGTFLAELGRWGQGLKVIFDSSSSWSFLCPYPSRREQVMLQASMVMDQATPGAMPFPPFKL